MFGAARVNWEAVYSALAPETHLTVPERENEDMVRLRSVLQCSERSLAHRVRKMDSEDRVEMYRFLHDIQEHLRFGVHSAEDVVAALKPAIKALTARQSVVLEAMEPNERARAEGRPVLVDKPRRHDPHYHEPVHTDRGKAKKLKVRSSRSRDFADRLETARHVAGTGARVVGKLAVATAAVGAIVFGVDALLPEAPTKIKPEEAEQAVQSTPP